MEHQIIKKSLKPTKEKCSQLSTNSQLLSNYSNLLKKKAFVGQSFVQIEQLRTLSSNAKEILLYHGILNDKNEAKDDQNDIVISNFLKNYDYGNLSQSHLAKLREIQYIWMELNKYIRFVYKNAIASTPCVVFNEKIPAAITNAIKLFSRRLCEEDCQQLFIRLEVLLKDFVLEARDQLNLHHNVKDLPRTYLKCLLASYGAFCVAADNLAPCIPEFNSLLMKRFSVSLQLLNKYLFHTCLYADAFVQNNVPYYISQLKTLSPEAYFTNQELIHSFIAFDDEMADIASKWYDVKRMILEFSRERVLSNSKQSVLLEDWEVYKENRELATTKIWQFRSFKRDLAEFDVQLLSLLDDITNHISDLRLNPISKTNGIKSCKNCIMKSFCLCDDCDNSHIVTYLDTPPASPIQDINYTTGNSQILQKYNAMSKEKEEKSLVLEKKINDIIAPRTLLKLIPDKLITNSIAEIKTIEELEEEPVDIVQTNIILPDKPVTDNAAILTTDIPPVIETTIVHKTANEKESPKQSSLKQSNHNVNTKKKLKSDLSCKNTETQTTTKANKENKHCDCPHCEVFDNTNGSSLSKNRTRDRLRLRLNEKQSKANKEKIATKQTVEKVESKVEIKVLDGKTKKVETKAGKVEVKPGKVETKTEKADIKTGKVETKMRKVETKPKVEVKAGKMIEIKSDKTNKLKVNSQQKEKIEATNNVPDVDTRNIRDLINFIEGIDLNAQLINAQKKAAKKARRREKKLEEERLKQEELDRIATEKAREEERKLKERLMKSQPVHHNSKKGHKNHDKIAKHTKNHKHQTKSEKKPVVVQPTPVTKPIVTEIKHVGPMVTIKRVMECTNSEPTVTITLKGSTPDKDKLLYTLVNGQTDLGKTVEEITSPKIESNSQNNNNNNNKNNNINVNNTSNNNSSINSKKKNKKSKRDQTKVVPPNVKTTTELINNNSNNSLTITKKQKNNKNQAPPPQQEKVVPHPKLKEQKTLLINVPKIAKDTVTITAVPDVKKPTSEVQSPTKTTAKPSESSLNLHMLRLPPGITITKVDGPTVPRKIQNPKPNPPVMSVQSSPLHKTENRSGVIVVDTVKLKETHPIDARVKQTNVLEQSLSKTSKKKNKRKNKNVPPENNQISTKSSEKPVNIKHNLPLSYKLTDAVSASADSDNQINGNSIVTIKNPLFYQLQESLSGKLNKPKKQAPPQPKETPQKNLLMQQASIIRGANGMVTIRSPSLGTQTMQPCTDYTELIRPNQAPSIPEYKSEVIHSTSGIKPEKKKPFNAQEILGGLPGIEITKVNNRTRNKHESKVYQPADVSIIPTNIANGTNGDVYKLFSDNVDWSLESVFAPKDIKEDEVLDAEELELEAFKRFCQQSVPPKRKEKVAHLNVKDIVLKKKNC